MLENTHNTYGLRFSTRPNKLKMDYELEFALQKNPFIKKSFSGSADSYYYKLQASKSLANIEFTGRLTTLGPKQGTATTGFSAPLGAKHSFNGWADVFSSTVSSGSENGLQTLTLAASTAFLGG